MNAIDVSDVVKIYPKNVQALKGVSLRVPEGSFFGLIGANGAGKTTLIGILTGLVIKTSGNVRVFNYDFDDNPAMAKRYIGVVPQEFNFNMFETTQEIVVHQAGYYGIPRKQAMLETEHLLKTLGLWEKRRSVSRSLSGGMKRRLMIARALVHQPRLLILDEPTAGVDVELRYGMWEYLKRLNQAGTTILLTTHYLEEAEQLCDQAAIIKDGQIVKHDSMKTLLQSSEKETYLIHVCQRTSLDPLAAYHPRWIDNNSFEIELSKRETVNHFIEQLTALGIVITDIRPKGNRLERLFLDLLRE